MDRTIMLTALRSPALGLTLAMAITGTVGAFVVETKLDPATVVFWRCVFASLFLIGWCLVRGSFSRGSISVRGLAVATLAGVCLVLNWVAFFAGFSLTTIATTTIVYHVQPFFVVLIGTLFLNERVSAPQLVWMCCAFTGVALASGAVGNGAVLDVRWLLGIGLTLMAAFLYAITTILAKQIGGQRPEVTALCQTVTGVVLLLPFAAPAIVVPTAAWGWLIGVGVLHTGIAYVLMYASYPHLATSVIAILTFVYPLVAILIDWAIYHHALGPVQGIGLALIAGATSGHRLGWSLPPRRRVSE